MTHAENPTPLKVVAAMVIRNERPYLANCLRHLIENEIDYVIVDNDSSDATADLLKQPEFARHLLNYQKYPYRGHFDWEGLMNARQAAVDPIETDWILYVSADEIMHSYKENETIRSGIERISLAGFDVIDFNEFVFLPVDSDYVPDHTVAQPLHHYYFFEPSRPRLMRARKKDLTVSHVSRGGHVLEGAPFKLSEETFALRHYIFRNQEHAFQKYQGRSFRPEELARGWHKNRSAFEGNRFAMPPLAELERLDAVDDRKLNRARPRQTHFWQWTP